MMNTNMVDRRITELCIDSAHSSILGRNFVKCAISKSAQNRLAHGCHVPICRLWPFAGLIEFRSVPDVTPSSSAMGLFVLCSVHGSRNISL